MIKLGDGYCDETRIIAVAPSRDPFISDAQKHYVVYLDGGHRIRWDADAAEVQHRLEELGLIVPQATPMADFTEGELAEMRDCFVLGCGYAAKDENGRVWAYEQAPIKGERSWINNDAVSRVAKLTAGQYAALSFADECPLNIAVALEGVPGC